MGKIYPKAVDAQWTITVTNASGGDYLGLGYTVYYNFDIDNATYSNKTSESYVFNCSNLSFYTENDADTGKYNLLEISSGNVQLAISAGEFVDLNGTSFDPGPIYLQIIQMLGF